MTDSNDEHAENGVHERAPRRPYAEEEEALLDRSLQLENDTGNDATKRTYYART